MKITKYAQSTFLIRNGNSKTLLIDPGKYNFEGDFSPAHFGNIDVLVITHKHEDHFDQQAVQQIMQACNPLLITNPEIGKILSSSGLNPEIKNVGDVIDSNGFKIELIKTDHVVRDETVINFGLLIEADRFRIYHTSDTRLMEAAVLPASRLTNADLLCVPIGNRGVVMGIDDALYFCDQFSPKTIIPMHYDSPKDKDRVRPEHFVDRLRVLSTALPRVAKSAVKILGFGESIELQ